MITNKGRKKGGDSLIIACKAFLFLILLQRLIPRVCGEAPHVLFRGGKVTVLEKALEKSIVDMNFLS